MTLKKDEIHFLFFFAIGTLSNSEAGGGGGLGVGGDIRKGI